MPFLRLIAHHLLVLKKERQDKQEGIERRKSITEDGDNLVLAQCFWLHNHSQQEKQRTCNLLLNVPTVTQK